MDCILTVYSALTYREYRLPGQTAGTVDIPLSKALFQLPEDLRLALCFQDGHPSFLPSGAYTLRPARGKRRFPLPAEAGSVYFLALDSGGRLVLTLRAAQSASPAFRVYPLGEESSFSIGSSPENQAVYQSGKTVSAVHAVLAAGDGGHRLEDRSRNGVYLNRRRLETSAPLAFGDQIYIMGLLAVYLGGAVALDTSVPGLRVREDLAPMENASAQALLARALDGRRLQEPQAASLSGPAGGTGGQTVLLSGEAETVLLHETQTGTETVLEEDGGGDDATVLEDSGGDDATVLEEDGGDGATVLEEDGGDGATVLEEDGGDNATVLEEDGGDNATVLEEDGGDASAGPPPTEGRRGR